MLLSSEIFGIIAIGFALYFLRIIISDKNETFPDIDLDYSDHQEELESFVEIPMDSFITNLELDDGNNLDNLKEKINKFKERNRFYTL